MTSVDAIGYNGNYKGGPNVNDSDEKGKTGNIHAEVNALIKSNYNIKNKKMFITHSPCIECTKLIINHGIKEVYFKVLYRDMAPIQLLLKANIKVFQQKNKRFKEILK
jgi:dCMP deaminase